MPADRDNLSDVFRSASALEALGTMLIEAGDDLPPVSAIGIGHLLKLVYVDLQRVAERMVSAA
jgi:hypothetical protein